MEKKGNIEHVTGLRGVAAILIVLFYLNSQTWSNAYLGIDIFLVITGHLLFSSRRNFNGFETMRDGIYFIVRRLQKIIPPSAIIIIISIAVGAFLLWWEDEWFLSKLGLNACIAKANLMLIDESQQIFTTDSTFVPLLHMWYISALVQIYVLWAVGNQLLQKLPKKHIVGALSTLGAISLIYCCSYDLHEWLAKGGLNLWEQNEAPSYYAVFPRLWEVLAGGIVVALPSLTTRKTWATLTALIGFIFLLGPALISVIPGLESFNSMPVRLITVIGAVLVIRYAPAGDLANLLNNKPIMWLGRLSFSLYLVSVPVIVFGRLWSFGEPSVLMQVLLLAVSFGLAYLLREKVEKKEIAPEIALALWGGAILLSAAGRFTDGFRDYVPSVSIDIPTHKWQLCRDDRLRDNWPAELTLSTEVFKFIGAKEPKQRRAPLLTLGDQNRRPTIVLIGDSHAAHHYAGFNNYCLKEDLGGVFLSCSFLPFHNWKAQNNTAKEQAILDWLRRHPELTHVIIAQRWNAKCQNIAHLSGQSWANADKFEIDLRNFLISLRDINKQVILVAPGPEFDMKPLQHYCKVLNFRGKMVADIAPVCTREQHRENNKVVTPILEKMAKEGLCSILDPQDALEAEYDFRAAADNTLLMYDQHHMYAEHSIYLIERLVPQLRRFLGISPDKPYEQIRETTPQPNSKK